MVSPGQLAGLEGGYGSEKPFLTVVSVLEVDLRKTSCQALEFVVGERSQEA